MRLRTTHSATVYGETVVGTDADGTEHTESSDPVAEMRGRFRPQGDGLTRERRGERIDSSPEFVCRTTGRDPDSGDQIDLTDVVEADQRIAIDGVSQTFVILRVDEHYGRGATPVRLSLELQATTDE